jgi:hypothetical protein
MKKASVFIILIFFVSIELFSQVAITADGSAPDNSAMLDVKSANRGFLAPRIALTATNSAAPVSSPAEGLLVYNTATAGSSPNNVIPGFYCWKGTRWTYVLPPPGANAGDLLRWDGQQWSCLAPGSNGKTLLLSSGIPTWGNYYVKRPKLLTNTVSGITNASATGGGNAVDGGAIVTERGVCWSTSSNPTTSGSKTIDGAGGGTFISNLTGLTFNTTYYVRAYATNSLGTGYGNEVSFTTRDGVVTLTTDAASGITATTATSGGNITDNGGTEVTARGVCWRTTPGATISDSKTSNGSGNGIFSSNLTGLAANTLYYVRAYATNSVGTSYGNEVSFTTRNGIVTLTTSAVSCIAATSATCGGNITDDGGAAVTARGVCWSTTPNPTNAGSHTTDGSGNGSFTSSLTGLTSNTLYYVRAYATNSVGVSYGNEISFTSSPFTIGQSYGGGIVFYIDCTGLHGLIAPTSDQSAGSLWGCLGTLVGASGNDIGTGQANTTAIVTGCGEAGAARICDDLVLNGFSDWFLSSYYEMKQMAAQQGVIGGFSNSVYWSSTETAANYAWAQDIPDGPTYHLYSKNSSCRVRCTRAF